MRAEGPPGQFWNVCQVFLTIFSSGVKVGQNGKIFRVFSFSWICAENTFWMHVHLYLEILSSWLIYRFWASFCLMAKWQMRAKRMNRTKTKKILFEFWNQAEILPILNEPPLISEFWGFGIIFRFWVSLLGPMAKWTYLGIYSNLMCALYPLTRGKLAPKLWVGWESVGK